MKERDIAVDIVKFFAVFLIINSHADACYPKFGILATGGAIGDSLFMFVSGFTLYLGKQIRFDNYYKRRINRIYPSAIAATLFLFVFTGLDLSSSIRLGCTRPFLNAIMIYYVILWFIRQYTFNKIPLMLLGTIIVTGIAYIWFPYKYETGSQGIYGITTIFRWIPYFGMMLLGAWVGLNRHNLKYSFIKDACYCMVCLVVFYGIQFAAKKFPVIAPWQIVTVPFLAGIVFYFYKVCNASMFRRLYNSKLWHSCVLTISGLCLESYLIQDPFLTDKLNSVFPFNLPIIFVIVLGAAYLVRCVARFISQTFRTEDYEWKKIFSLT
jgi:hypothetical protein